MGAGQSSPQAMDKQGAGLRATRWGLERLQVEAETTTPKTWQDRNGVGEMPVSFCWCLFLPSTTLSRREGPSHGSVCIWVYHSPE
jgi:hypothetical protein